MSKNYTSSTAKQRERLLERLRHARLSTLQARQELDILHPAARVSELRQDGHPIMTHWTIEDTGKGSHRVAYYVLLSEGGQ